MYFIQIGGKLAVKNCKITDKELVFVSATDPQVAACQETSLLDRCEIFLDLYWVVVTCELGQYILVYFIIDRNYCGCLLCLCLYPCKNIKYVLLIYVSNITSEKYPLK